MLPPPRSVVWLWGHEHRFAAYEGQASGGNRSRQLTVYGRAVGNSGVDPDPVEDIRDFVQRLQRARLTYADNREVVPGSDVGYNGFALLTITERTMTIDHHAVAVDTPGSHVMLTETFTVDDRGDVGDPATIHVVDDPKFFNRGRSDATSSTSTQL